MTTRNVTTEAERGLLLKYIGGMPLPFSVNVTKGRKRTVDQNRLQRQWMNEIAEQLGDRTAEEVRGECKMMFAVPILRAEDEDFREAYDKYIKARTYDAKMGRMMEPLDFPVTRLMKTGQHARYLDAIHKHFTEMGLQLTTPTGPVKE